MTALDELALSDRDMQSEVRVSHANLAQQMRNDCGAEVVCDGQTQVACQLDTPHLLVNPFVLGHQLTGMPE
jgi:hypothetical protein